MKTYILKSVWRFFLVTCGFVAVSCGKNPVNADIHPGEDVLIPLVFRATDRPEQTKMTGIDHSAESAIGNWAVCVIDNVTGVMKSASSSSASSISMSLVAGHSHTVYAAANYPSGSFDPYSIRTAADFTEKVSYLSENALGRLIMTGSEVFTPTETVVATDGTYAAQEVNVRVKRLVARIDVSGISIDFSEKPHLASRTFVLKGIYLTNLYRTTRYGNDYFFSDLSDVRSSWYNTGGWHRGESAEGGIDAMVGDIDLDTVLDEGTPYTVSHSFYAYANPTAKSDDNHDTDGAWTKRCTRIVIEVTMDDDPMYYTVDVPAMNRNYIYSLKDVVIRDLGLDDPESGEKLDDAFSASFSVFADDWYGPYTVEENS